jgi:phosphoglycolate phosphatase-like HAD superfamily hydrolase
MIKLVAFDWNGTILADTKAIVAGDNAVLKYFGRRKTTLKEVQKKFIMPIRDFYIALHLDPKQLDKNPDKMWSIFAKAYEPLENKCRTRSGVKDILQYLQYNKIRTVIFSNHIIPHIHKQLHRLNIYSYVDRILARPLHDVSHLHIKSKDKKISELVDKLKIKPKEVMVVGDTEEEIEIAKHFGYYSVGLTGGNISTVRLKATKPDFLIHNLKDLKKIIQRINKE